MPGGVAGAQLQAAPYADFFVYGLIALYRRILSAKTAVKHGRAST
jgi:hypothetical protein